MAFNRIQYNNFINNLTGYSTTATVVNQYTNSTQIQNLEHYLKNIEVLNPTILLVGEAPSYNGCSITGIPFTSEFIIKNQTKTQATILVNCIAKNCQKEQSATIFWDKLEERALKGKLNTPPLIWNIFPFHPHPNGKQNSNRKPVSSELIMGLTILNDLITLFPGIKEIYAIGKVASKTIKNLANYKGYVCHPANGGKTQFNIDMDKVFP